ncbi:hypothetical protein [Flavobacterium sp.]|uniref:hypothetical protein n=1 Tax=Flavobacterium sp. TaxID=239 RepID=UPI00286AEC5D|nr:hypothetical protein [Flavobacterium sp.]
MKKIILLIAIVGTTIFCSCEGPEGPQGATGYSAESAVLEYPHVNLTIDQNGDYTFYREINTDLEDNVVIYRLSGTINSQTPIWQPIPRTVYFDNGDEFDYDYDFSRLDFTIYAGGNYDIATSPELLNNQTFRVVIIPGYFANKSSNIKEMDYDTLIAKYNIDDSKVKVMN